MKLRLASLLIIAPCLLSVPVMAQLDLYDNGPTDGTTDAYTINFGFEPSDSFQLSTAASVNGLQFAAWLTPGDLVESVEVSITSNEFGGTVYFDQQVSLTQGNCVGNQFGFNVCDELGTFNAVNLNAGTYWLNLQNAVVNTGDPVYWDQNDGPSMASEGSLGTIQSESFTILGSSSGTTTTTGTTPEPGTLMLFGSGVVGLLGLVRRQLGR
jgi:hypothetical protein